MAEAGSQWKTVGVIGGMGPQATVDFFSKVIAATPVDKEQDHLKILIHNDPGVPNRHDSIAGRGPSAAPAIVNAAQSLERAGADFLVMPSHTPHAYAGAIRADVSIPFVSMVDRTAAAVEESFAPGMTVGLLSAEGCLAAGLYQAAFARNGRAFHHLEGDDLDRFMRCVFSVKANVSIVEARPAMIDLAEKLAVRGADVIVAACTEVPLLLDDGWCALPLLDPTDLLARETVRVAMA